MKPKIEELESRYAPTVAYVNSDWASLSVGTQIADADPLVVGQQTGVIGTNAFGDLSAIPPSESVKVLRGNHQVSSDSQFGTASLVAVSAPASIQIVGSVTTSRILYLVDGGSVIVSGSLSINGGEVDGGFIVGTGTVSANGAWFNSVSTNVGVSISASNSTFNTFLNNGSLSLNGQCTLNSFTNSSSGRTFVSGSVNVSDFLTQGFLTVDGTITNVGGSGLTFGVGSVTTVNRVGPLDNVGDGLIDLGPANARLDGGLMKNFGLVGSVTPGVNFVVGFNGLAVGSGLYSSIITENGGHFSPGGSPNTMANVGGNLTGSVTPSSVVASGNLTVSDSDLGESMFRPSSGTTLYGSFTINSAGHWTYTLDPNDAELILALAHATQINDEFTVLTADGTEVVLGVFIHA